jgi:hypothetical protein
LRKLKTNVHTKRAVIRIVPISTSNAVFECHCRSMNVASVIRNSGS